MIFAAGLGTRLRPLTDTMPKALVPVAGIPLLGRVVTTLRDAGCDRIIVNVHHFPDCIVDYLRRNDNFGIDIRISDETEQLLDTGGGLKKAAPFFRRDEPILIHNVDIISNARLKKLYEHASRMFFLNTEDGSADADALLLVSRRETSRYLLFDNDMGLIGRINIKNGELSGPIAKHATPLSPCGQSACNDIPQLSSAKRFAFSGIHIVSPRLIDMMGDMPDRFGIIDFYLKMCVSTRIKGLMVNDLKLLDVGKTDTLADAERFLKEIQSTL